MTVRIAGMGMVMLGVLGFAMPVLGQVSTDDKALDQLSPAPAAKSAKPAPKPAVQHKRAARAAPVAARLAAPRMPAAPPANPVILPPKFTMPVHAAQPPQPVPVVANAPGVAMAIPGGTRITFGAGGSDLNPATLAAIQSVASQALAHPAIVIDVTAWAPGTPDDPSTPRRLSLDRALAARAVMIHAGVMSDRIRAVAKGSLEIGTAPADRVDVVVEGAGRK